MIRKIKELAQKWFGRLKESPLLEVCADSKPVQLLQKGTRFVFSPGFGSYIKAHELGIFVLYKLILTVTYVLLQSQLFKYSGFTCEFDFVRFVVGWALYLFTFRLIRSASDDIGSLFIYTVFLLSIAPFIVFYEYSPQCKLWMVLLQVGCLWLIHLLLKIKITRFVRFPRISYKNNGLRIGTSVFLLVFLVYTVIRFGLPDFSLLSFENIHLVRKEVELTTLESILQNVVCKILCPIYLIIALREKKWLGTGLAVLVQFYVYAVTGFKTYLFIPVLILVLQLFPKLSIKQTVLAGLPAGLLAVDSVYSIVASKMLYALVGNRVIFLPAQIKYCYFDYFSRYEFVYFSQSTFAKLFGIKSNYGLNIPNLIGAVYYNKPEMWTNTGFMADAYANLGVIGMVLISLLMAGLLIVLRQALRGTTGYNKKMWHSLFIIFFIALNDGALITTLFSGGLLAAILVALFVDFREPKAGKQEAPPAAPEE